MIEDIEARTALSFYKTIAELSAEHSIYLVQHLQTGKVAVRKNMPVYNRSVYDALYRNPVPHTPHIVLLYEENSVLTVIEEYISGETLESILQKQGNLSEEMTADYMLRLCSIVRDFHAFTPPIIHRDIKPSNIMITASGELYLLDFNAAKHFDPQKKADTVLLGTHGYAAPEQYGFGTSGVTTDIYTLGMVMLEMLTGTLDREKAGQTAFSGVIDKCIRLDPTMRYQSVSELAEDLERVYKETSLKSSVSPMKKVLHTFSLPGFRSGIRANAILAAIGYFLVFYFSIHLQVNSDLMVRVIMERASFFMICMLLILFTANYRNVHRHLPFCMHPNPIIRWGAVLIFDAMIAFSMIAVLVIIENAFGLV